MGRCADTCSFIRMWPETWSSCSFLPTPQTPSQGHELSCRTSLSELVAEPGASVRDFVSLSPLVEEGHQACRCQTPGANQAEHRQCRRSLLPPAWAAG